MSIFWFSFNAITPLILLVVLGYVLKRFKILDQVVVDKTTTFLFKIAFPVSLFNSIIHIEISEYFKASLFIFSIGTILGVVALLMLILPRFVQGNQQRGAMIQGIYRGNILLLGYPLARNLFGEDGVGPIAMLMPVVIFVYNILAVFILEYYGGDERKVNYLRVFTGVAKNPLIFGAVAGIVFSLLSWELPMSLSRTVDDVAKIANPFALILLGAQFSWSRLSGKVHLVIWATALRQFIIPIVTTAIAAWIGFRGPELGALMIVFGAPTAVTSFIMAKNMNSDSDLASQIVVSTTLASGVSLFVLVYSLRALALI